MKTIVITGVARGLGLNLCERLLEEGYRVVGILRTFSNDILELKKKYDDTLFLEKFDLSDVENLKYLCKKISKVHAPIYGLINNAALGHDGVLATMHESQISELIKVNIESPITITKYLSRSMLLGRNGRIINVGSIIGSTGFNGLSVYGATKAALEGFSRSLSRELGKANITVNTIAPGYMKTSMTEGLQGEKLSSIIRRSPMRELADVSDVSAMAVFLLSEEASMITGATFTVDAGSTA